MITQKELKECLDYNEISGIFTWKKRLSDKTMVGGVAGTVTKSGYIQIKINGKLYLGHRLAWLYCNGYFPNKNIDHINGIKSDNRIFNLRQCNQSENNQNQKLKAGTMGTSWNAKLNKWMAKIGINKQTIYLGYYLTREQAHEAYLEAKLNLHGFQNVPRV